MNFSIKGIWGKDYEKIYFIYDALLLMGSILGGCSSTSNGTKNNSVKKTSIIKTKTSYYQNLSKADKKNVKFKFSQDKDETKDNSI
ncbi:hypothetical protein [Companilactobacillus kedongensis]|uniref:hypothetical protein n=1 Tax=Companilactobacillus kedongensis TaxID=2486004 RepID=UPI000F782B88|nr:hypothetical protein [Companilactobacillus kedongensis]